MNKDLYSADGAKTGTVEMADSVFSTKVNEDTIYQAIRNELANKRVGTAATKGRSEIRGSGAKRWRQKGTGRARSGDVKSPIVVGGGTVFGPKPRSYNYKLPRKVKRNAMKSILSLKAQGETLKVVEDFAIESGKTREMNSIMSALCGGKKVVLVTHNDDAMTKRAARNIPWLKLLAFDKLSAHVLFYGRDIVLTESAVKQLNQFYAS